MASSELIDRIVANVLKQLSPSKGGSAPKTAATGGSASKELSTSAVAVKEKIVTAELLIQLAAGQVVVVAPKAIVTPAAWDVVRDRELRLQRGDLQAVSSAAAPAAGKPATTSTDKLLIVVRSTSAVEQVKGELSPSWRRELLGCPDDAAKLAIGELSRGGAATVVILAEQTLRAACLANRSDKVKAVPINSAGDVKVARSQLKANTWCLDPGSMSYFELRNALRTIEAK